MKTAALLAAVMAGVTFYAAVYHVLLHVRTGQHLQRDVRFGMIAFGIGLYDTLCARLYLSDNLAEGAHWQRLQLALVAVLAPLFVYFIDAYAEIPGPKWVRRAGWVFPVLGMIALVERRGWLLTDEPDIKQMELGWLGQVVYYEEATGPLFLGICAAILYVLAYALTVSLLARREGARNRSRALLVGVSVFVAGVTNDALIAAGSLHSIYVIEFAFTAILMLVSYSLSAEVVEAAQAKQALAEREVALSHTRRLESIGRLAGGVAHDLNNMLTPVLSYLELVRGLLRPDSLESRYLASASDAAARAAALTQQLLALGRKQVLEVRPVDLGGGLRTLAPLMRHLLPKSVTLNLEIEDGIKAVEADASQLDQVWMNLTANARDAMPEGGTLTFSVRAEHEGVGVNVTDTGMGMSAETVTHIFEPFFTTKVRGKGTGLGLSIVRGIVEQHGGRIELESAPGQGTTFHLWFPASSQPVLDASPAPAPLARGHGYLLVVDDDESVRTLVATLARQHGYQVQVAGSEAEVRAVLAETDTLDLLISDVILPDTDGPRVRKLVTARFPTLPCLFMTGHADELLAPRGILRRDIDLLRKPFTREQLLSKIDHVLQRARSRTESRASSPPP